MPVWQIVLLASALLFAGFSVFLWLWNVLRAKKLRQQGFVTKKENKQVKMPVKLDKVVELFGGIDNILGASASRSKLKVTVADQEKVDVEGLKKMKHHGVIEQSGSVSIVLGRYAPDLSGMINDLVTLNNTSKKAS